MKPTLALLIASLLPGFAGAQELSTADALKPAAWKLDGTNLLPVLTNEKPGTPHETLYWRFRFPPAQPALHRWAIRHGDWKLVENGKEAVREVFGTPDTRNN